MIQDHDFSDCDLDGATYFRGEIIIDIVDPYAQLHSISLQKEDVEALARHFDLIPAPPTFKEKEV
jgi:hypothetical protein